MAISFGSDYAVSSVSTSNTRTDALTLGSTGANAILFVLIEAADNNYTPITIEYNGVSLTSLGGKIAYVGAAVNTYKELYYINNNLTSGQNLFIDSNATTGLGQGGARSWIYRYWTYGGVTAGIGTTKIDATDFTTSNAGSPVSVAFNFTPSSPTSKILQMLPGNSVSITTSTYGSTTGTMRQDISPSAYGSSAGWLAFSDYEPGSTSLYSVSQSFNPNFTSATGYGWAIELLQSAAVTSKNTQAVWI